MKAKKIVYLMLIMVVLISGVTIKIIIWKKVKKTSFSNEKHQILRRIHLPLSLHAVRHTAISTTISLQRIITERGCTCWICRSKLL